MNGPSYATSALGRRAGYLEALSQAGIAPDTELMAGDSFSIEAGSRRRAAAAEPS